MNNPGNYTCPSIVLQAKRVGCNGREQYYFPRLEIQYRPKLQVLEDDDVIIEPIFNGICGTDVSILKSQDDGKIGFRGPARLPVVIGHEFAGIVTAVGAKSRFSPGDYVASESIEACGACHQCSLGHLNQCLKVELVGLTRDGALSSSIRIKDGHVYSIQKLIDRFGRAKALEIATLLEPAGCSYNGIMIDAHGSTLSRVKPGSTVAVFGCGPIGLLNVALAKAQGAGKIVAFDPIQSKVDMALRMGATNAFVVDRFTRKNFFDATDGQGANLALEASGSEDAVRAALSIIAPRGVLVIQGRLSVPAIPVDPNFLVSGAISIVGVRGHAGYGIFDSVIDWFSSGSSDFIDLIHPRKFSFFDASKAIEWASVQPGKVLCVNPDYMNQFDIY